MKPIRGSRVIYYTRQLAEDREEYLSGKGEAPGRWGGSYADRFRLHGQVSVDEFERLYDFRNPASGERLGRAPARNSNATLEVVFRPSKDIALLWAFGDARVRKAVEASLRAGNTAAMGVVEQSAGTRVGKGGREHVAGSGLLWATFTHRVNRENQPLPHFHNVVMNRTQTPDGKWLTLDGRDLIDTDAQRAFDAVFTAVAEHELTSRLGVEFTGVADEHGFRQVVGISREAVAHYSKRSAEITAAQERALAEKIVRGGQPSLSYKERDAEVHKTRKPKVYVDMERLHDCWQRKDRTHGLNTAEQVTGALGLVRTARERLTPEEERRLFNHLAGPTGLTRQASTFTRHDVLKAIVDQAGGLPLVELERLTGRFLGDGERTLTVDLDERKPRWTTHEARQVEQRLLDLAATDRPGVPVVDHEHVAEALAAYATLGDDQRLLVSHFTRNPGFVALGVGQAGTGKTFMVNACRHAWQRAGVEVIGAAHTGTATTQLRDGAGIEHARTLDSWLLGIQHAGRADRVLPKGGVVVIDEAGQTDTRKLERFLQACAQSGTAVRMIGDAKQLQSIDMGGAFRALQTRLGARELTVNRRQRDPLDREILALLREGQAEEAMGRLVDAGRVTMAPDRVTKEQLILANWWRDHQAGKESDILSPVWEEVDRLNRRARQLRQVAGQLGSEEMLVAGRRVAVGERIICRANDIRRLGITNGTVGYVTAIDPSAGTLTLKTGGREVTLPKRYLHHRTGHGRRDGSIDYAYARTRASVQGITNDTSHISALPGHGDLHDEYVAASRAREGFRIYGEYEPQPDEHGDHLQRADALAAMTAAAGRERQQVVSLDATQGPGVHTLTLGDLRAERDRLAETLTEAADRSRGGRRLQLRLARAALELQQARDRAEQAKHEATALAQQAESLKGWRHRAQRRDVQARAEQARQYAEQATAAVTTKEVQHSDLRGALDAYQVDQQQHVPEQQRLRLVEREIGDRTAARRRALALDTPAHLRKALGTYEPVAPADQRRRWQTTAQHIQDYRQRHQITDPEPLGPAPKDDLARSRERTRLARQAREVREVTSDSTRQRGMDWEQRHNRPASWRPGDGRRLPGRDDRTPHLRPPQQRTREGRSRGLTG